MKRIVLLLLMAFAIIIPVQVVAATLIDKVAVAVPAGLSTEQIENAIIFAMNHQRWVAESRKQGEIVAVLRIRVHVAKVKIDYDARGITVTYLDSTNLDYKETDSGREIHGNYNVWVSKLTQDTQARLSDQVALAAAAKH